MKNYLKKNVIFFKVLKTVKHYARQACLVLAILLVTVSCEKEEVVIIEQPKQKTEHTNHLNLSLLSWEELEQTNSKVTTRVEHIRKQKLNQNFVDPTKDVFSIEKSAVQVIEKEGYKTYTFFVRREQLQDNILENYSYKEYNDGTYEQYFLKYHYTRNEHGLKVFDTEVLDIELIDQDGLIINNFGCTQEIVDI